MDIRRANSGEITKDEHSQGQISAGATIGGGNGIGVSGRKTKGKSFKRVTSYVVNYTCAGCGRDFDNGDTMTVLSRDFQFSQNFVDKYRIATSFNDFIELKTALEKSGLRKKGRVAKMQIGKPSSLNVKIDGQAFTIILKKVANNGGRIVLLLEDITGR